jgi:hypothetical protein
MLGSPLRLSVATQRFELMASLSYTKQGQQGSDEDRVAEAGWWRVEVPEI